MTLEIGLNADPAKPKDETAALRARRYRRRHRTSSDFACVVWVDVSLSVLTWLIESGHLPERDAADIHAVGAAIADAMEERIKA